MAKNGQKWVKNGPKMAILIDFCVQKNDTIFIDFGPENHRFKGDFLIKSMKNHRFSKHQREVPILIPLAGVENQCFRAMIFTI